VDRGNPQYLEKMMKRFNLIIALVGAAVLSSLIVVAAKPDFSGSWTMDRARSFGMPGNMQQTMIVKQTAEGLELETKLIQPDNERTIKDNYILDGKEHDFTPPMPPNAPPNAPAAKGKRTANWLPAGNGIMVSDSTTTEGPNGPVTSQLVRKWTLSSEGELVIDMYIDGPNGSFETKRIFKRQ
jgi:hypothetical protein